MPGPYKRKKYHFGDTHLKKRWRTKRRKKDLDEINEDLKPEKAAQLLDQEVDLDKPGDAQYYCLHCAYGIKWNCAGSIPLINRKLMEEWWRSIHPVDPFSAFFDDMKQTSLMQRYFIDETAMNDHFRTKVHKRRLKALEAEPYTIEDSEKAAGHGSFVPAKKRKMETQQPLETTS